MEVFSEKIPKSFVKNVEENSYLLEVVLESSSKFPGSTKSECAHHRLVRCYVSNQASEACLEEDKCKYCWNCGPPASVGSPYSNVPETECLDGYGELGLYSVIIGSSVQ